MNQRGQSLLEIVITIGVIMVVISGLAITTINGLKNSQFSKNQVQATKLAQEALTKVKVIRNLDYAVSGPSPATKWSELWAMNLGAACSGQCRYILKEPVNSTLIWLQFQSADTKEPLADGFQRQIIIEDFIANQKKVTVGVIWSDYSGTHQSQLVTILAKY